MPTGTGISFNGNALRLSPSVLRRPDYGDHERERAPDFGHAAFEKNAIYELSAFLMKVDQRSDLQPDLRRSISFRDFLSKTRPETILCDAFAQTFSLVSTDNSRCLDYQYNKDRTVAVQVVISEEVRKIYVIEVRGKSELLALHKSDWTERHRFYVLMGFSGDMQPYLLVWDAQHFMKNTPNVDDADDRQYQSIDRAKYDLIESFQERVKSKIARLLKERFEKFDSEAIK